MGGSHSRPPVARAAGHWYAPASSVTIDPPTRARTIRIGTARRSRKKTVSLRLDSG